MATAQRLETWDNIPEDLRRRPQWCVWRLENVDGKDQKNPRQAPSGRQASSTNPSTWADYETAIRTVSRGGWDGVSYVLTDDDPFTAVDIDDCIADGQINPEVTAILDALNSYTEYTPSGTSLRVWLRGSLPEGKGRKCDITDGASIEVACRAKAFTVTGNALALYPETVEARQAELDELMAKYFPPPAAYQPPQTEWQAGDEEIVQKMLGSKHGAEILRLWNGDISKYNGDASAADFALAWQIGFYTQDKGQIERIMRRSSLVREKWDRHPTYLSEFTIPKALASKGEHYNPDRQASGAGRPLDAVDLPVADPDGGKGQKPGQTEWVLQKLEAGEAGEMSLYQAPDCTTYIRLTAEDASRTWPIRSAAFRQFLRSFFYARRQKAIREEDLKRIIEQLDSNAACDGSHQEAYLRVAPGPDGEVYIDLHREDWSIAKVTADGWEVVTNAPVLFRRGRNSLAMPEPERQGRLDVLRNYLNVDDDQWILLASCLVSYFSPYGPYPVISISGEQGSGKSTACRIIKLLVDPAAAELYSMPTRDRDIMTAAQNNWLLAYENLSNLPPAFSDIFCILSTGGGFSTRELYTDMEERVIKAQRPIVINGIPDIVTRPDLLGRSVPLQLSPILTYRTESEFRRKFEADLPAALGGLLDAVSCALQNLETTPVDRTARMADFAQWAAAASHQLGWTPEIFYATYAENRENAEDSILESSPVAMAIEAFAKSLDEDGWTGTMSDLFERVAPQPIPREWPKNPRGLSSVLRRYAPVLRGRGVTVDTHKGTKGTRYVYVTASSQTGGANGFDFAPPEGHFAPPCATQNERGEAQKAQVAQNLVNPPSPEVLSEKEKDMNKDSSNSENRQKIEKVERVADFAPLAPPASAECDEGMIILPDGSALL